MKRWFAIVGFCVFIIPCAYGETITYDDGSSYVGDVSNGVPHGQGTYTFVNGEKYIGEYEDGLRHGQGIWTHPDGDKYGYGGQQVANVVIAIRSGMVRHPDCPISYTAQIGK